jgi:peptide/nickel transport system substrate-binding protein
MRILSKHIPLLFCLVLFLSSCQHATNTNQHIFYYNESSGIASLDPAFAKNQSIIWPVHQLYNTLVEVDDQMHVRPSLAKTWTFSKDLCTIVFTLRSDVYFHDDPAFVNGQGRKLNARDVVYSFNRIINPTIASPGGWIFNNRIALAQPFLALNDSMFQLTLIRPFQPVIEMLSNPYCSIVPHEAVEKYGTDFRRHPVGTGPFQILAWEEGQSLLLHKNPHYFEIDSNGNRLPYLEGVYIHFYTSKATEFLAFQQHQLDFINDLDVSFKDEMLTKTGKLKKQWESTISLDKQSYLNTEYLGILMDSNNAQVKLSPLRFKKIRQAINYGIDRKKMLLYLRNSIGLPANSGFVPAGLPSFDSSTVKGYSYDPSKAKQLLKEAGFSDTHPMPLVTLLTIPNYASLGTYIVNELKQLGINVQLEVIQKSLLLEQTSKSQAMFFRGSWIADYPDAENYLSVFYSKNPAPPNYTRYANPRYDDLYEASLREQNDSIRYHLYKEMDAMIVEEAPIVPLWYDRVIHLTHKNLLGFHSNSMNLLNLKKVKKIE